MVYGEKEFNQWYADNEFKLDLIIGGLRSCQNPDDESEEYTEMYTFIKSLYTGVARKFYEKGYRNSEKKNGSL